MIQDNGPGIPEDLQPHLFDPFVSTKAGGSGLGLALVAKIVGDHGGVIEFDSQPRRTLFRLMLPMAPREEGAAVEAADCRGAAAGVVQGKPARAATPATSATRPRTSPPGSTHRQAQRNGQRGRTT